MSDDKQDTSSVDQALQELADFVASQRGKMSWFQKIKSWFRKIKSLFSRKPKQLQSPYGDSTQIGIVTEGIFTPMSFTGSILPQVSNHVRVYKSFKPTRCVVTEIVWATYNGPGLPSLTLCETVDDAADAVLVAAFAGADNCFPNAPSEACGVPACAFSSNANNGISWPAINSGIDMSVAYVLESTVLNRANRSLPPGYDPVPTSVKVKIRTSLLGPSLR